MALSTKHALIVAISAVIGAIFFSINSNQVILSPTSKSLLKGKRVIVTGGSKGIGLEVAKQYVEAGAQVMICARTLNTLEQASMTLSDIAKTTSNGGGIFYSQADLSTEEGIDDFWKKSLETLGGGVDVLVLNHVVGYYDSPLKEEPSKLYQILTNLFQINTLGVIHLAHRALGSLEQSQGSIVVVSSLGAKMGLPSIAPYSASKHALHGFFDSYRLELIKEKSKVSISTVVLGNIDTQSNRDSTGGKLPQSVVRYPAKEAAAVIVGAELSRAREVYYPKFELISLLTLRTFFPTLTDWIVLRATTV